MTEQVMTGRFRGVLRDLAWLEEMWPDLLESRIPGTDRPWREPTLSPEMRAELEERDRHEREARGPECLGESPAPVHVDVLDTLSDLLMAMDLLHEHVAQTAGLDRLPSASSAFGDPAPYLAFVRVNLAAAIEADDEILDAAADKCAEQVRAISRSLSLLTDGQTLKAVCPWCRGVTPHTPAGGAFTLRVRMIRDPRADAGPDDQVAAVVCGNDLCDPPDADCGHRDRGRPAWLATDWDWLARRLETVA
jgi:hypothetical protein